MSAGRQSRVPAVACCLLGFALLCLVVTSEAGPVFLNPDADLESGRGSGGVGPARGRDGWDYWTDAGDPRMMTTWFGVVLAVFVTGIVVAAIVVFVRWLTGYLKRRRELMDVQPADTREWNRLQAVAEVEEAAERALSMVQAGRAGDAVTAYWQAMQVTAADAGLPRAGWETSSEYVHRVVAELGVCADAAATLAALFREVRFSGHELDPGAVDRARDALEQIRADLAGARTPAGAAS